MKVLVITRASWSADNNIGNTMDNLFNNIDKSELHNMYFRSESHKSEACATTYQISEQQLIKSIITKTPVGKTIDKTQFTDSAENKEKLIYNASKKNNFKILWFVREWIWSLGNWKNTELINYISKINPDIIFMPAFGCFYPYKVLLFILRNTKAKCMLFHADDNYSLKQFSLSPIYWIYRFRLRYWVRKCVNKATINFAISNIQKQEYEKIFKKPFNILYKSADFSGEKPKYKENNNILQLVFTGNISSNRWKTLVLIGRALDEINTQKIKAQLVIYTATPISKKMQKQLSIKDSIVMMGSVPSSEMEKIQKEADVLVHVESFDLRSKLEVRMSFSTKIVDYLSRGKCILGVGPSDVASIDYLIQNDCAVVANNRDEILKTITDLITDNNILDKYGDKAWECGVKNHNQDIIKKGFESNLKRMLGE